VRPIEEGCICAACRQFSRAYVRHLMNVNEILGIRLLTIHNLHRYREFELEMRAAIEEGRFGQYKDEFLKSYKE
jgi:queuine tRNA-ribosyltransferase